MKKLLIIFFCTCFVQTNAQLYRATNTFPQGTDLCQYGNWIEVFHEDFNSGTLDLNTWVPQNAKCWGTYTDNCHNSRIYDNQYAHQDAISSKDNVFLIGGGTGNGACILQSKHQPTGYSWFCAEHNTTHVKHYTYGAMFLRDDIMSMSSGKVEVRAALDIYNNASWNAIWLWSDGGGELDFPELYGWQNEKVQFTTQDYGGFDKNPANPHPSYATTYTNSSSGFFAQFHTYTVEWDRNFTRYFLDGIPIATHSKFTDINIPFPLITCTPNTTSTYGKNYYFPHEDNNARLIITNGLINADPDNLPSVMIIDDVKIYKRNTCADVVDIADHQMFTYTDISNVGTINLGTTDINKAWTQHIPMWGALNYSAEAIVMQPNFESSAVSILSHINDYPALAAQNPPLNASNFPNYSSSVFTAQKCTPPKTPAASKPAKNNNPISKYTNLSADEIRELVKLKDNSNLSNNNNTDEINELLSKHSKVLSKINNPTIYPNPTSGSFSIVLPTNGNYDIKVMNMMGAVVYQSSLQNKQKANVSLDNGLPSGSYYIQITGDNLNYTEQIILAK